MSQPQPQYLVPKITKNKLKPLEQEKRLRSKIFSNHELTYDFEKSESKVVLPSLDATARSPIISKVRSKMYSIIDESHSISDKKR